MSSWTRALLHGSTAGLAATAAMSTFMAAADHVGLVSGLPPRMIVDRLLLSTGRRASDRTVAIAHAGYGVAAGALFASAMKAGRRTPLIGMGYGLLLWGAGYEGWVPAIGALPPAHRDDRGRVITMIAAHLVYGLVLGARVGRL